MSARKATVARRGTRSFFRQVAEELPNHLPPADRGYQAEQWGRYYKVWFADRALHFEVQFLRNGALEIAFHMESDAETNQRVAGGLKKKTAAIRRALGDEPAFFAHGPRWQALREVWTGGDLRGEEAATEAAARLADYIRAVRPLLAATG